MKQVKIYMLFERIWHWWQAALIIFLMITGFEVHGSITVFGYEQSVLFHRVAGLLLVGLTVFAIFWHLTTDEWRQYIPTFKKPESPDYVLWRRHVSRRSASRA